MLDSPLQPPNPWISWPPCWGAFGLYGSSCTIVLTSVDRKLIVVSLLVSLRALQSRRWPTLWPLRPISLWPLRHQLLINLWFRFDSTAIVVLLFASLWPLRFQLLDSPLLWPTLQPSRIRRLRAFGLYSRCYSAASASPIFTAVVASLLDIFRPQTLQDRPQPWLRQILRHVWPRCLSAFGIYSSSCKVVSELADYTAFAASC